MYRSIIIKTKQNDVIQGNERIWLQDFYSKRSTTRLINVIRFPFSATQHLKTYTNEYKRERFKYNVNTI